MTGFGVRNFGKKPNRTIVVPPEFRPKIQPGDLKILAITWKEETGCDVVPQMDYNRLTRFDIFGTGPQLDTAVRAVNKWIGNARAKTPASSAWAKMPAFDINKWYYGQISVMEAERKEMFRGPVPVQVPHKVVVHWPEELLREDKVITPRDVFGNKLETLDPIRVDDEVFITLLPHRDPPWQVEISGFNVANVESAQEHYINMVRKAHTKAFSSFYTVNVILDGNEGNEVHLEQGEDWWPDQSHKVVPRLKVPRLKGSLIDAGSFRRASLDPDQLAKIQQGIEHALEAVRFERGSYDFTIRFGSLALAGMDPRQVGTKYTLPEFWKAESSGLFECKVHKWLVNHDLGDQLLARVMAADELLEPIKTPGGGFLSRAPSSLKETRPTFRGTWVLKDPNSPTSNNPPSRNPGRPLTNRTGSSIAVGHNPSPINLIVVQIDWTEDEDGYYDKTAPRFYRLRPGQLGPKEHIDINLLELGGAKAWHFGLESMIYAPRSSISPAIVTFAERITLKPGSTKDLNSNDIFAEWSLSPSTKLQFAKVERVYTFGIKKTCYQVECMATWYPHRKQPCWGITVRHKEWGMHLSELERLLVGHGAEWSHTIKTFLPDDGNTSIASEGQGNDINDLQYLSVDNESIPAPRDGITLLIDKLMQLSQVVSLDASSAPQAKRSLGDRIAINSSAILVDV